jgi:twinkle protein
MEYARRRYAISHFIIDSLAKCGMSEDDYNAQKAFVETLSDFSREHNAHVHLIAHARKGSDEHNPPGKMDVKGSGAITDLCDNVFSVWRNKPKEEMLERTGDEDNTALDERPDAVVACVKQRYGEWEGRIALWFDRQSLQYRGNFNEPRRRYVNFSAIAGIEA